MDETRIQAIIDKVKLMGFSYNDLITIAVTTADMMCDDEKLVMEYFERLREKVR